MTPRLQSPRRLDAPPDRSSPRSLTYNYAEDVLPPEGSKNLVDNSFRVHNHTVKIAAAPSKKATRPHAKPSALLQTDLSTALHTGNAAPEASRRLVGCTLQAFSTATSPKVKDLLRAIAHTQQNRQAADKDP